MELALCQMRRSGHLVLNASITRSTGCFFLSDSRQGAALLFLLLLCAGPSIALMFPVWLLGCLAHDAYRKPSAGRRGIAISSVVFASMILVLLSAGARIREFLVATNEEHRTAWLTRLLLRVPHHQLALADGPVPWLTNASSSFLVVGLATASVYILGAPICRWPQTRDSGGRRSMDPPGCGQHLHPLSTACAPTDRRGLCTGLAHCAGASPPAYWVLSS